MTQPTDPPAEPVYRRAHLITALKALTSLPAQTILYGSALLAILTIPGAELAGPLAGLATGLGMEALGNILDRMVNGDNVSAEEIQDAVNEAIANSHIDQLLTTAEFQTALGQLLRQQHLIRAAVEQSEYALADQLAKQYAKHELLFHELQHDLLFVQNQLPKLATGKQSETILLAIKRLEARLSHLLPPENKLPYTADDEAAYLDFLQKEYGRLRLPDGDEVPLERIYVSLKADAMNAAEREAEHRFLMEDVETLHGLGAATASAADEYRFHTQVWQAIKKNPRMKMLQARNWEMLFGQRPQESLSLAEVVQQHQYAVILGDPGSGKTTLCRWLALQFGQALAAGTKQVRVPADQVRPGDEAAQIVDFGLARLPLLIRISEYAEARFPQGRDNDLTLNQFIERGLIYPAEKLTNNGLSPERIGPLAAAYLARGRALLILDGLDEVGNPTERRLVMEAVEIFIQAQQPDKAATSRRQSDNKVLLTSRIVGYQFRPLTHLPHYTVEEMDETAIRAFTHAWLHRQPNMAVPKADIKQLQNAILNASPGVQTLAGNPLLLTIMAQVWQEGNKELPARRVDLFRAAEKAFFRQRRVYWQAAHIKAAKLNRALSHVAMHIHREEVTGFASEEIVCEKLEEVLPDPDQVEAVLKAARDVSGFLIARGEGVYGFLHRGLQEYFAACYLTQKPSQTAQAIAPYVLDPTWREPLVLAVGLTPGRYREKVFETLLDADDPAGDYLPRRELLAVSAARESNLIPPATARQLSQRLLSLYSDCLVNERSQVLQARLEKAWGTLWDSLQQTGGGGRSRKSDLSGYSK